MGINWNLIFLFLGFASRAILTNRKMVIEEHVDLGLTDNFLPTYTSTTKNPTSFNFNFCESDSISRFEQMLGQKSIWLNFADEIGPFDFRNNRVKFNSHMILRGG